MRSFDADILSDHDVLTAMEIVGGGKIWAPDLVITPDGNPYIYRWYVIPRNSNANVYFHIQVASDPERPLHDHPWANTSHILSGGYDELYEPTPWLSHTREPHMRKLRKGDVIHRAAQEAHRLILPPDIPYTMSLFTTGPKVRKWGFWFEDGWRPYEDVTTQLADGRSVMKEPGNV